MVKRLLSLRHVSPVKRYHLYFLWRIHRTQKSKVHILLLRILSSCASSDHQLSLFPLSTSISSNGITTIDPQAFSSLTSLTSMNAAWGAHKVVAEILFPALSARAVAAQCPEIEFLLLTTARSPILKISSICSPKRSVRNVLLHTAMRNLLQQHHVPPEWDLCQSQ